MLKKVYKKMKKAVGRDKVVVSVATDTLEAMATTTMLQNGKILSQLMQSKEQIEALSDVEFKVFSQWGDDGIIQYLVHHLNIERQVFVEFGVENYLESNTRFLLVNNNWSGFVMDGSEKHINHIVRNKDYWKYDLRAKCAFVTAENINDLITSAEISGEIGLLHIDIDGNDYWIWKALEVVSPVIMIVEYNSVFGDTRAITVPYKPDFYRTNEHHSNLYAGASLAALCDLAEEKGYDFVGCNSAGNNAYFIKKTENSILPPLSVTSGYVASKFRESRDENGALSYLRGDQRLGEIQGLPIFNTRLNKIENL